MGSWTGFIRFMLETSGCFEQGDEPSGSIKCGEFLDLLPKVNIVFSVRYGHNLHIFIIINLSNDRSKASSKTIPPHSAIYSFLLQLTVSSPVLKVIQ